jgi:hypothetical protein
MTCDTSVYIRICEQAQWRLNVSIAIQDRRFNWTVYRTEILRLPRPTFLLYPNHLYRTHSWCSHAIAVLGNIAQYL